MTMITPLIRKQELFSRSLMQQKTTVLDNLNICKSGSSLFPDYLGSLQSGFFREEINVKKVCHNFIGKNKALNQRKSCRPYQYSSTKLGFRGPACKTQASIPQRSVLTQF